nr:tape measure protein [Cellulomonas sp. RIT-PI-Y]
MTVGELVAYIRADGTQFDRTVDQSGSKFQSLGNLVRAGTKALATSFVALTTGAAAMGAAVFKIGADYNRLQQSSRAALTTLLGSAEAANAQMDKLDAFAKNSPFAKQVFISAQQQLLGFGVQAEKVLPILDAVQNAVAAVGGSNQEVSQVTYALAQMQGQGKLTGETLNQLGQYGIDAASILGQQLGKTGAEIRELASKPGGIPVDQVWDPLVTGLMSRFGGATANIKLQFDGAVDRVKGAIRDIGSILAAPFIDPNGGGRAVEWANKLADALRAAEAKAKPFVDLMVARFKPGLDAVTPALDKVRGLINSWDLSKVNVQLDKLTSYTPLIAGGSAALYAYGTQSIPVLSKLGLTVNPLVAGVAALVATSPGLRAAGADFLTALAPLLPVVQQLVSVFADTAMEVGQTLTPSLSQLLQAIAPVAVSLGEQLAPVLVQVMQYAVPLAEQIADVVSWVAQLPGPVLTGAAAFGAAVVVLPQLVAGLQGMASTAAAAGAALKSAFIGNPVTLAITAIATAIGIFVGRSTEAKQRVDTLADSFDTATGAITENTRAIVYNNLQADGTIDRAKALGINLQSLVDAALDPTGEAYQRLADRTEAARQASVDLAGEKPLSGILDGEVQEAAGAYDDLKTVLVGVTGQSEDVAAAQEQARDQIAAGIGATDGATAAFRSNAEAVQASNDALQDQIQAQKDAAGVAMSLREAQIQQTEAQKAANDAAANGAQVARDQSGAIDLNADSTIMADKALLDLAARNAQVTDAMTKQNASGQELYSTTLSQREAFINTATSMGYTRDEASRLANEYGLIPQTVTTTVKAETTDAEGNITRVVEHLNNINGRTYTAIVRVDTQGNTTVTTGIANQVARADGAFTPRGVRAMAEGGHNRQAQYAAAGSNILWAEEETGGETYIPHALSKRRNATKYLDQTARLFGYQLISAGTTARADGAGPRLPALAPATASALTRADLDYLAVRVGQEVLAGARDVSALALSVSDRAARGSRTTAGVVR